MKRRELIFAGLGVLLLAYGARQISSSPISRQTVVLDGGCRTPATIFESIMSKPSGTAIVIHGLSANRRLMLWTGEQLVATNLRVYLIDLPGHGDSTDHFSFARSEQCATEVIETLAKRGEIQPDKTILVGHSMGAAIAVRMADCFPAIATIAISPGPMVLPRRMPANLLVFSAQYDLALLRREANDLAQAAAGERTNWQDFKERRAFELIRVPHATHTSLLLDPRVSNKVSSWIRGALNPEPEASSACKGKSDVKADHAIRSLPDPLLGVLLVLVGLALVFPLAASLLTATFGAGAAPDGAVSLRASDILLRWVIAALLGVCVLNYVVPLRPLHMFTGDYLASLLLLVAILVWILSPKAAKASLNFLPRAMVMGIVLGLATMLAFGAWLNWQSTDAWLNAPRWLRFVFLVLLSWPYFFMEEVALGAPPEIPLRGRRLLRFALFLLLRLILWLACIFALYAFTSGQILVLILGLYLALVSIFQRLGCDAVRRRTGSPTAAAAFGAILASWFIAAVFPLT
jgi:pimeloyl-ACP methyl ester carboxylesterase